MNQEEFESLVLKELRRSGVRRLGAGHLLITDTEHYAGDGINAIAEYKKQTGFKGKKIETKIYAPEIHRAAVCISDGTMSMEAMAAAAEVARQNGCDIVIACSFQFPPTYHDVMQHLPVPVLRANIHPELQCGDIYDEEGDLFVVPHNYAVSVLREGDKFKVQVAGDFIASWNIDTDYNFKFINTKGHVYFMGQKKDPFKHLRTALKGKIDAVAWDSMWSDESKLFDMPAGGFIAVSVWDSFGNTTIKIFDLSHWKEAA